MARYICSVCGYVYDEEKEGRRWNELPETWVCPWCGAPKSAFNRQESFEDSTKAQEEKEKRPKKKASEVEDKSMPSVEEVLDGGRDEFGIMAVVCSNLARACEKQYMDEEAELFRRIGEYFDKRRPKIKESELDDLVEFVVNDLSIGYPGALSEARQNRDSGAERAILWNQKATNILKSVLERYELMGDKLLKGTNIYVCQVCGFVYIGDNPPEVCPICKVPRLKIHRIEGRAMA